MFRRVMDYDSLSMTKLGTASTRNSWLWIVAIWSAIGLFDAIQTVVVMRSEGMHHAWFLLFWTSLLTWLPWILATPFILDLGRRYPVRWRSGGAWVRHLAGCGAVALLASAWIAVLNVAFNPYLTTPAPGPFLPEWSRKFWSGLLSYLLLYAFVLVVSHVLDSKERLALQLTETARLNELLSKAQLNALRRQIEPHFLFNTLNAISGLVREQKNDAAVSTIAALSDMLRRVVQDSNRAEVPLSEELEFLERYLEIQTVRFAERLRVTFDVPEELLGAQVPSLILQPLVENAVKHGIAKRTQGGEVRISGSRLNGMVAIRIYNDGPVLREDWQNGGTGVENVRTRLESLYGKKFELSLQNEGSAGVEVLVSMPYKEK